MKAWADSLGGIEYPLLSDFYPHGEVAQRFGVFRRDGTSERALVVIDRKGIVRYVDVHDYDTQPDNELLFKVLNQLEFPEKVAKAPETVIYKPPQANIVMFCTSWCPTCRTVRDFFRQNKIEYVEVDIGRDRLAAGFVRSVANGNETTPTFLVGGEPMVNFDKPKLEKLIRDRLG